jgi:hypothetical protein
MTGFGVTHYLRKSSALTMSGSPAVAMQQCPFAVQQIGVGCVFESYQENKSEEDFLIDRRRRPDLDGGWHGGLGGGVADLSSGGSADIGRAGSGAGSRECRGTVAGANVCGLSASVERPDTADENDDRDGRTKADRNGSLNSLIDKAPLKDARYRKLASSPNKPTDRVNARPMTGSATCGIHRQTPDIASLIRATLAAGYNRNNAK